VSVASRLNARLADEVDPVRRADILADRRLAAAVILAPRIIVVEALLAGLRVPAARLDATWVRELHLQGDVLLDDELAVTVVARGPIAALHNGRKATS
jgi:hypothetical protein